MSRGKTKSHHRYSFLIPFSLYSLLYNLQFFSVTRLLNNKFSVLKFVMSLNGTYAMDCIDFFESFSSLELIFLLNYISFYIHGHIVGNSIEAVSIKKRERDVLKRLCDIMAFHSWIINFFLKIFRSHLKVTEGWNCCQSS